MIVKLVTQNLLRKTLDINQLQFINSCVKLNNTLHTHITYIIVKFVLKNIKFEVTLKENIFDIQDYFYFINFSQLKCRFK